MDIERMKKISEAKIKAGKQVSNVRNTLKEIKHGKQMFRRNCQKCISRW